MPDWIVGSYLKQASLIIVDWFVAKCLFRCRCMFFCFCFFFKFLKLYSFKILEWDILFPFLRKRKQNCSAGLSLFSDKLPLQLNCRENIYQHDHRHVDIFFFFFFFLNYRKVFKQTYADLAGSQVFPTKNTRLFVQPNVKWNLMFTTYAGPLQSQFGV